VTASAPDSGAPAAALPPSRLRRNLPLLLGLALAGLCAWALLSRITERAAWLIVEVPAEVPKGRPLEVRITLPQPVPAGTIKVDLHWKDQRGEIRGFLSAAPRQATKPEIAAHRFLLPLPGLPSLAEVYAVAYLSPDGRWEKRTRAAVTEEIAVVPPPASAAAAPPGFRRVDTFELSFEPVPKRRDSPAVRWLVAMAWLTAAAIAWRRLRSPLGFVLTAAALLAAAGELLAADTALAETLRGYATAQNWYEGRRELQRLFTATALAFTVLLLGFIWRRSLPSARAWFFTALVAFAGAEVVSVISLHGADRWLNRPLAGIPAIQLAKLAAATVAVLAARRLRRG
jgi:hypothetical protein